MSRAMKYYAVAAISIFSLLFIGFLIWTMHLYSDLNSRLSKEWFTPPVEFYYPSLKISSNTFLNAQDVAQALVKLNYRNRPSDQPLHAQDFALIPKDICSHELSPLSVIVSQDCLRLKNLNDELFTLVWDESGWTSIYKGVELQKIESIFIDPKLIGEVRQGMPVKVRSTPLSEIPLLCLQAVTAIEDNQFLQHKGVSPSGFLRAVVRNLLAGKFAQGGSTITQQLVKNYFLSNEKTIKRKITEQILAVFLETKLNKDQILEKYLNVIYMGQDGPFQIIGAGAASQHYFSKSISDLNLEECALLAALINSPGRFSPFKKPENALKRRSLVFEKMLAMNFISQEQMSTANATPLPEEQNQAQDPSAPYFLEATYNELVDLGLDESAGFKVLTSLDPNIQIASEKAIQTMLPTVAKRAKPGSAPLESATLSIDLKTQHIVALVGGHNYRLSPFNRVLHGRRQMGSIVKPFIYWLAYKNHRPWDMINDEPFVWKYEGQTWKPQNYDKKFRGEIPLYDALVKSLNVPAVKLSKEVGLAAIRDALFASGYTQKISTVPSIALGTVEMTPMEIAQIYSTMANFGSYKKLSSVLAVHDLKGEILYESDSEAHGEERMDPKGAAAVISSLKLSQEIGTAQGLKGFGVSPYVAGKTGTTNDLKDSWFVGFDPNILTVVWVGYDNNETTGLTGSSGALPIWGQIYHDRMKRSPTPPGDFAWPKDLLWKNVDGHKLVDTL